MLSKEWLCSRQATKSGAETGFWSHPYLPFAGSVVRIATTLPGSLILGGRNIKPFTTLKISELAAIPSASVTTAAAVNPGFLRSMRTPNPTSMKKSSIAAQRHTARLSSSVNSTFPNSRRAAASASFLGLPCTTSASIFYAVARR